MPNRKFLNAAFLAMAIGSGLTLAIANPSQDLLMNIGASANVLMNFSGSSDKYIQRMDQYDKKKLV